MKRLSPPQADLLASAKHQRFRPVKDDENWILYGSQLSPIEMKSGCGFLEGFHFHPHSNAPKRSTYEWIRPAHELPVSVPYGIGWNLKRK